MRFFTPKNIELGASRMRSWFAWLPVKDYSGEVRWLEYVTVRQEWRGSSMMGEPSHEPFAWCNIEFIDPKSPPVQVGPGGDFTDTELWKE